MKTTTILRTMLLSTALITLQTSAQTDLEQARQWTSAFAGQLKPKLQQAMKQGGPAHAIEVCAQEAPRIAQSLSEQSGWAIKRVSLKPRNQSSAKPDAWEEGVLKQFDKELATGKPVTAMFFAESVDGHFRYMQPQPVEAVCLACHGEKLSDSVQRQLERYAPGDMATGYQLGQIRGAFSLSKPE